MCMIIFFFFFSSRRRHTRWPRDWSSDVCSSDLTVGAEELGGLLGENLAEDADCDGELVLEEGQSQQCQAPDSIEDGDEATWTAHPVQVPTQESLDQDRSEERRVGKEWRSRWAPEEQKDARV